MGPQEEEVKALQPVAYLQKRRRCSIGGRLSVNMSSFKKGDSALVVHVSVH